MDNLTIREFLQEDESELIQLFFEFGEYLKKCDENAMDLLIVPENYGQKFYSKMVTNAQNKNGKVYVLTDEHKVVGFVGGVIIEVGADEEDFDCKPHRMGRITDLFLNEKYRGLGYGTKLMSIIENYFKEKGCLKINIDVFGPNVDSYNFYKKHGYSDRNIDLAKVI